MAAELSVVINGTAERIDAEAFVNALRCSLDILGELDAAISLRRRGILRWAIGVLQRESPAVVSFQAVPMEHAVDISPQVVASYLDGLELLATDGTLPPLFSDDALEALKRLARLTSDGQLSLEVRSGQRSVILRERVAAAVDELIGHTYTATGSVEGTLEMVTVHGQGYFRVYDSIHGWGVPCYFQTQILDTIRSSLGHRVVVNGTVRNDRMGKPLNMRVESLEIFPQEADLPTPVQLRGIAKGMTQGRSAEDYLREIRGDRT